VRRATAPDVLTMANAEEETTSGTSGTVEIRWPRARRRAALEEAAIAEAVAKRLVIRWLAIVRVSQIESLTSVLD
jgi:hypothetical protein